MPGSIESTLSANINLVNHHNNFIQQIPKFLLWLILDDKWKAQRHQKHILDHPADKWQSWNLNPGSIIPECVLYHYILSPCGSGRAGFLMPMFQMWQLWFREPKSQLGDDSGLTLVMFSPCHISLPGSFSFRAFLIIYGAINANENSPLLQIVLEVKLEQRVRRDSLQGLLHTVQPADYTHGIQTFILYTP